MSMASFAPLVHTDLRDQSGSVFYAGDKAFATKGGLYVLGLNPGGRPENGPLPTIAEHLSKGFKSADWNSYLDEPWQRQENDAAGKAPIQRRLQHLVSQVGLDLRSTPASNLIFVRTASERDLSGRFEELADLCWPFHQAVVDRLEINTVLCFGASVGAYVRRRLSANTLKDTFVETNARGWKSSWYVGDRLPSVVILNHPSRANWLSGASDPSKLVSAALDYGRRE